MKRYIFTLLVTMLGFAGFAQETPPPVGPNFKQLATSTFFIQLPDSVIWQYKGTVYGWAKLARYKDVKGALDQIATKVDKTTTVNGHPLSSNVTVTKGDVALGNVANLSPADLPISSATQAAIDGKQNVLGFTPENLANKSVNLASPDNTKYPTTQAIVNAGFITSGQAPVQSVSGKTGAVTLVKGDVGLGSVDNTSDASKPISTLTQAALDTKVDKVAGKQLSTEDYTSAEKSKLAGITPLATKNETDAFLLSRVNHTGTQAISTVTNLQSTLDAKIPLDQKGMNNGVAPLDGSGKVPAEFLPSGAQVYKGTWDASTNTPTLADGTGTAGWTYRVSVGGTRNLGSGNITFVAGDDVIYNGSLWQRNPSAVLVNSVNGQTGTVVITKTDVGLGNADNTSDLNKAISTATQTALNGKANTNGSNAIGLWPIDITGNSATANNSTLWAGQAYDSSEPAIPAYLLGLAADGKWHPANSGKIKNLAGIDNGSTLVNNISGNAATATLASTATDATAWNGNQLVNDYAPAINNAMIGFGADGKWHYVNKAVTQIHLDINNGTTLNNNISGNSITWNGERFGGGTTNAPAAMMGYDSTNNRWQSTSPSGVQAYVGLNTGSTLTNSITGSAVKWNGSENDFSSIVGGAVNGIMANDGTNVAKLKNATAIRTFLGSPSGGETLQSVLSRGNIGSPTQVLALRANDPSNGYLELKNELNPYESAWRLVSGVWGVSQQGLSIYNSLGTTPFYISEVGNTHIGYGTDQGYKFAVNGGTLFNGTMSVTGGDKNPATGPAGLYTSFNGNSSYISSLAPNVAWQDLTIRANKILFGSNGDNIRAILFENGNLALGSATDLGARLGVNGNIYSTNQIISDGSMIAPNFIGNASSATNWGGVPANFSVAATAIDAPIVIQDGIVKPAALALFRTWLGLGSAAYKNESGTWNIDISGNAGSATNWGGNQADFTTYGTDLAVITGFDGIAGKQKGYQRPYIQAWLGLGSNAYTSTTIPTNTNQLTNGAGFITSGQAPVQSVAGKAGTVTLVKGDVGLNLVDNTSDASKPVSTATQTALDAKYNSAGGEVSGVMTVKMNSPSASVVLDVGGYTRAQDFIVNSDSTLKKNIVPLQNSVQNLMKLKGYSYDWKRDNRPAIGVIAQEIQKVYPEIVFKDDKGILNVDYSKLVAPLIQANNEQQKEIEQLKKDIQELKLLIKR